MTSTSGEPARLAGSPPDLTPAAARLLTELARVHAGLNLKSQKRDFLRARLTRRLAAVGAEDFSAYARRLASDQAGEEIRFFVEALTTHTTSFFREEAHFHWLEKVGLPALAEQGAGVERPLQIWSAACSTGQELYSALMLATEVGDRRRGGLRVQGLGTDISARILGRARNAVYPPSEIAGLDEPRRRRFLLRAKSGPARYRIAPELRRKTLWRPLNLTGPAVGAMPEADIIFVRNVLIYFDYDTQAKVIEKLSERLRPGGYLLTGHSENAPSPPPLLRQVAVSVYERTH